MILTQILPFADPAVLDTFGQFERAVYNTADRVQRMRPTPEARSRDGIPSAATDSRLTQPRVLLTGRRRVSSSSAGISPSDVQQWIGGRSASV